MINVFVIGQYKDAVEKVEKLFTEQEETSLSLYSTSVSKQETLSKIEDESINVVIFAMSGGDSELLDIAKKIYITKPQITLVLYLDEVTKELSQKAFACGIRYAGVYPSSEKEMEQTIIGVYQMDETRNRYLFNERKVSIAGATVIGFYGVKSGIGRTTLAINTAIDISKNNKSVVLIDLDSEFGNVANYMDIMPKKTIVDMIQDFSEPSINDLESYMTLHSSGVHVIPAPKSPEYAEVVNSEKAIMLVNILKKYYDYIIINMPSGLNDFHINVFKCVNRIYFVTNMAIAGLKNSKNAISVLNMLQEKHKINVIVSRFSKYDIVTMKDIHNITGCRIVGYVPSDYKVMVNSTNTGIPIIVSHSKHPVAKAIHNIVLYTLSEDDQLDIWDMNSKKIEMVYKTLQTKISGEARKNKASKSLFRK